jgi:hypothetical protein
MAKGRYSMEKADADRIFSDLEALKKLKLLELLDRGYSQSQLALTLGVGQASISRMFPKGALGKKRS